MTIKEALEKGTIMLKGENLDSPKLKARLLLQDILNKPRQYLIVHDTEKITETIAKKYFENILKVKLGTPIEHITHIKEFMKMNFYVDENVLIPRQDTEILVEEVMKIAKINHSKKILDLCTGSGAIGISIAKYMPEAEIIAIDISPKALMVAKKNAKINNVENQITFMKSDLFEQIKNIKFDIIVSNPPYIKKEEIKKLNKEVQKEPIIALDGGMDGLDFYRKIVKNSYLYLKYGGYLALEIGFDEREEVEKLIKNEKQYVNTYSKKDLYGNDRIVITKVGD
ncbi:MAG: peptide chain release factor N(5)-glutamine methyltransferase [Clostridia bacterium]|nr:peptide chain release factor N(5)-glutamine methyltransferase [Clostridia bacterium]